MLYFHHGRVHCTQNKDNKWESFFINYGFILKKPKEIRKPKKEIKSDTEEKIYFWNILSKVKFSP